MRSRSLLANRSGTAALEFALVVPALLLFVFGMFNLYGLSRAKRAMDFGIERALRYAAIHAGGNTAAVVTAYCNAAIIISADVGGATQCTAANVTVTPSTITAGQPVTVTATYTWAPPAGYAAGFTPQFISTILNATGKIRVLH